MFAMAIYPFCDTRQPALLRHLCSHYRPRKPVFFDDIIQRILRIIEDTGSPKGVRADNDDSGCDGNSGEAQTTYGDGGGGEGGDGWGSSNFTDAEECLWLRVFGALELYARPCRSDPQHVPTPPDLVPLDKAVSVVEEIFGCRSPGLRSAGLAAGPASQQRTDAGRRCGSALLRKYLSIGTLLRGTIVNGLKFGTSPNLGKTKMVL